jgi:putative spermidine/putrescine transport system ATP-binding protein/putrescine transport system ATP-binding protein
MSLGDSIIVMNEGRIEQEGTPSEIYARPTNRFVANFVGRSNWLPGIVLDASAVDGFAWIELANGSKVRCRRPALSPGSACEVFVRPEAFTLSDTNDRPSGEKLAGRIHDVSPLGSDVHVSVDVDSVGRVVVVRKNIWGDRLQRGERITLAFDASDSLVFARDR